MGRIFQVLEFPVLNVGGEKKERQEHLGRQTGFNVNKSFKPSWRTQRTCQTPNPTCCLQTVRAELQMSNPSVRPLSDASGVCASAARIVRRRPSSTHVCVSGIEPGTEPLAPEFPAPFFLNLFLL